jgi:hypothetical protein
MPNKHRDGRKQYGLRMEPEEHALMMEAARRYDIPAADLVLMAVRDYARRVGLSDAPNGENENGKGQDDDIAASSNRSRGGGDSQAARDNG